MVTESKSNKLIQMDINQ